jgi:hypothetical protein
MQELVESLQIITTNDMCLLGTCTKTETGYTIENAVEFDGDLEDSIKELCKKHTTGDLKPICLEGSGVNISKTELSTKQKMVAKITAMKAAFAADTAVDNLKSNAIDNI